MFYGKHTKAVSNFNFENQPFNVLTDEQGNLWFVGSQVAKILGYGNTKDALARHVDAEDKKLVDRSVLTNGVTDTVGNLDHSSDAVSGINTKISIINESGLYSLIMGSKLPNAKKFKRWVTSEVLPSIRKTGKYEINSEEDQNQENVRSTTSNVKIDAAYLDSVADMANVLSKRFGFDSDTALVCAVKIKHDNSLDCLLSTLERGVVND